VQSSCEQVGVGAWTDVTEVGLKLELEGLTVDEVDRISSAEPPAMNHATTRIERMLRTAGLRFVDFI